MWTSSTFAGRAPSGHLLLRTMIGGATFPDAVDLPDNKILELFQHEIGPILKISKRPQWRRIYRFPSGIAQYNLGPFGYIGRS